MKLIQANKIMIDILKDAEKVIAVACTRKGSDRKVTMEHITELILLAETAGAEVVHTEFQELQKFNNATLIGKGKVQEIKELIVANKVTLVLFDDELSPIQLRNLTRELECKVLDRAGIILEIFARRAKSNEAKTQVELAYLQYMMPRLSKMWSHLSKQHGGIGTKGPGETQIESDRRAIRARIDLLKEKLKDIEHQQEQTRRGRAKFPKFALVGYTNAGKSTLMKTLTQAEVYIKDELFATLDTTVRGFKLPLGTAAILSDTVGFIRKLPSHLIASFRSTLAEARESDFLLHVIDVSSPNFRDQIKTVDDTLEYLGIDQKKVITVFNKVDLYEDRESLKGIEEDFPNSIFISASSGYNITGLLDLLQKKYDEQSKDFTVYLPYSNMNKVSMLYKTSDVLDQVDGDEGSLFKVRVEFDNLELFTNHFKLYIKDDSIVIID